MTDKADKTCAKCGRKITWRKKWERSWAAVKHCSAACRRGNLSRDDQHLENKIIELLAKRTGGATICPSEAARAVFPTGWQDHMEEARQAARRLVAAGAIVVTQHGQVVDPSTARGPIRLRRVRA